MGCSVDGNGELNFFVKSRHSLLRGSLHPGLTFYNRLSEINFGFLGNFPVIFVSVWGQIAAKANFSAFRNGLGIAGFDWA